VLSRSYVAHLLTFPSLDLLISWLCLARLGMQVLTACSRPVPRDARASWLGPVPTVAKGRAPPPPPPYPRKASIAMWARPDSHVSLTQAQPPGHATSSTAIVFASPMVAISASMFALGAAPEALLASGTDDIVVPPQSGHWGQGRSLLADSDPGIIILRTASIKY
jgi:hypothetical protein